MNQVQHEDMGQRIRELEAYVEHLRLAKRQLSRELSRCQRALEECHLVLEAALSPR